MSSSSKGKGARPSRAYSGAPTESQGISAQGSQFVQDARMLGVDLDEDKLKEALRGIAKPQPKEADKEE